MVTPRVSLPIKEVAICVTRLSRPWCVLSPYSRFYSALYGLLASTS